MKIKPNGCTMSPDFNFKHCCDNHDIGYQKGGGLINKIKLDVNLFMCIAKHRSIFIGLLYLVFVLVLGNFFYNWDFNNGV